MPFSSLFAGTAISSSGMTAERFRMEVIAHNLANANTTKTADGGPFRRQDVAFAEVLGGVRADGSPDLRGVAAVDRVEDPSDLRREFQPGHPDADADGWVLFPNVSLPDEMVNLLTAARAYEANLRAAQTFRTMNEQALTILRG